MKPGGVGHIPLKQDLNGADSFSYSSMETLSIAGESNCCYCDTTLPLSGLRSDVGPNNSLVSKPKGARHCFGTVECVQ